MSRFPFRACGGHVLLERVKQDGRNIWLQGIDDRLLQFAEVVGKGARWPQWRKWEPPVIHPHKGVMLDGTQEKDWKPSKDWQSAGDFNYAPRPIGWGEAAALRYEDIAVGDIVVFVSSRVYTSFRWGDHDILVYPGNWLYGVLEDHHLAAEPERRRYEYEPV